LKGDRDHAIADFDKATERDPSSKVVLCRSVIKSGETPTSLAAASNIMATNCDEATKAFGRAMLAIPNYCGFHADTTAPAYRRAFDSINSEFQKNREEACKTIAAHLAFVSGRSLPGTSAPPKEVSKAITSDRLIIPANASGPYVWTGGSTTS
jgi:hypothetical protein